MQPPALLSRCPTGLVRHAGHEGELDQFAIVFAAMGVNMETAHFFKQVRLGRNCMLGAGQGGRQGAGVLLLPLVCW